MHQIASGSRALPAPAGELTAPSPGQLYWGREGRREEDGTTVREREGKGPHTTDRRPGSATDTDTECV